MAKPPTKSSRSSTTSSYRDTIDRLKEWRRARGLSMPEAAALLRSMAEHLGVDVLISNRNYENWELRMREPKMRAVEVMQQQLKKDGF